MNLASISAAVGCGSGYGSNGGGGGGRAQLGLRHAAGLTVTANLATPSTTTTKTTSTTTGLLGSAVGCVDGSTSGSPAPAERRSESARPRPPAANDSP